MKRTTTSLLAMVALALLFTSSSAFAQISLNTAQNFGVLGGSTITNTGPTVVNGDVGVSPGSAVVGFPPGIVIGTIHAADAVAGQAQTDLTAAYNTAAGLACGTDLTGQNLGGLVLSPGVYCFDTSAQLTGTLTLDLQGNPNSFFLFQIGSTLTTASASSVLLINTGGTTCPPNVFWQIGSSATLGTGSSFTGNILSLASVTMTTGANLNGRALARNGAVTLDSNAVTSCASSCPIITVSPATLPDGEVGIFYSETVTASGATGPFTFSVSSGTLPAGLTLNPGTGLVSGIPTGNGSSNFTITATNAGLCSGSRAYSIVIRAAAAGIPSLDLTGLTILMLVLGGAAVFVLRRTTF
jgi:hypothetical protein